MQCKVFVRGLLIGAMAVVLGSCSPEQEFFTWRPLTPAQQQMREQAERVSQMIGEGSMIGAGVGAAAGAAITQNASGATVGAGLGSFAGSIAGLYVASKQRQSVTQIEVLRSMTADVRAKNDEVRQLVEVMQIVLDEDRRQLATLQAEADRGAAVQERLRHAVTVAQQDKRVMERAADSTQRNIETVHAARDIVLEHSPAGADAPISEASSDLDWELTTINRQVTMIRQIVNDFPRG